MSGILSHPTIGITAGSRASEPEAQRRAVRNATAYRRALAAHGARVIELAPEGETADPDALDGLVLTGGGDVHPRRYGQEPHPSLTGVDEARDELELALVAKALAQGMPVLGICRGCQVLGVAAGGDLIQDVATMVERAQQHRAPKGNPAARHTVRMAEGSLLMAAANAARITTNSFHHQANGRLGPAVRAVGWAPDGVVEAIESEGSAFVVGVQWHPERMWRTAPRQRRLFGAFVSACRDSRRALEKPSKG